MYPIHHQIRKMLSDFPQDFSFSGQGQTMTNSAHRPSVDILEKENSFEMTVSLPGLTKEQVDIQLEEQFLTIQAETPEPEGKDGKWLTREIKTGKFIRRFRLGAQCQKENIQATMEHGVLKIEIPKTPANTPSKIQIQ